jgi:hypothetical protein
MNRGFAAKPATRYLASREERASALAREAAPANSQPGIRALPKGFSQEQICKWAFSFNLGGYSPFAGRYSESNILDRVDRAVPQLWWLRIAKLQRLSISEKQESPGHHPRRAPRPPVRIPVLPLSAGNGKLCRGGGQGSRPKLRKTGYIISPSTMINAILLPFMAASIHLFNTFLRG